MSKLTEYLSNLALKIKTMKNLNSDTKIPASEFINHIEVGEVAHSYSTKYNDATKNVTLTATITQSKAGFNNILQSIDEKTLTEIDSNFIADNIADGVTIFGITGTYVGETSGMESCKLDFTTEYWYGNEMGYSRALIYYSDENLYHQTYEINDPQPGQSHSITVAKNSPIIVLADADICFGFGYGGTHENLIVMPCYYNGVVCYCTGNVSGISLTYND